MVFIPSKVQTFPMDMFGFNMSSPNKMLYKIRGGLKYFKLKKKYLKYFSNRMYCNTIGVAVI